MTPGPTSRTLTGTFGALLLGTVCAAPATGGGGDPFAACEERYAAEPEGWRSCGCFYGLAVREGRHAEATRRLEGHLDAAPGRPCLLFNLGRLRMLAADPGGDGEAAADLLRRAAEGYAARSEHAGEVYARINLSRLLRAAGDAEAAQDQLETATPAAAASGDAVLLAEVELQRARLLLSRGVDLEGAEALLRSVEARAFPGGHASLQRDTLLALGTLEQLLGRHAAAEEVFRRMIDLTAAAGDLYGEASARQNLAIVHLARLPEPGVHARSAALFSDALEAARAAGQRQAEADARRWLGQLLGGEAGRRELESAVTLARELGDGHRLAVCLGALAAAHAEERPGLARRHLEEAVALNAELEQPIAEAFGWLDRMKVEWATLPREEALAASLAELDRIEGLRAGQGPGVVRARAFSLWADAYDWLAGRLLEEGLVERSFEVTERRRARELIDALDGARMARPREVSRQPVTALPTVAGLEQARAALAADEALLSFQLALWRDVFGQPAGGSWLLVATREGSRAYRLADRVRLEPALEVFLQLFRRRDGSEAVPAARLYGELLAEALPELPAGVRRLVIVPDGLLHLLPFAALRPAPGEPSLAERYELSRVPSASLWLRWRTAPAVRGGRPILALADPELPSAGLAESLEPLPYARREGRAAVRRLGRRGRLLVGAEAAESVLPEEAPGYGVLHLAAHAVVDAERPQRSAVVLAAGGGDRGSAGPVTGPDADGLLQPAEIAALELEGATVVLSACRSAVGTVLGGEGPMSLARAFFEAGARAVVGSLWPLRDDDAAELFDAFYRRLAAGESLAAALAGAQRERLAAGAPAVAWAGVVVLGDGAHVPFPGGSGPSLAGWLAAAGLLAITVMAAVLAARRR